MRLAFRQAIEVKGGVTRKLKIGIVGAGVFGRYHAGKCMDHPEIDFMGVYDHSYARSVDVGGAYKAKGYKSFEALLGDIEALIIASPAVSHGPFAIQALRAGRHCLIEKPIAATLAEAEKIVELAEAKNLLVQVGHQERFVIQAIGLDKVTERPLSITGFRMGPYSTRGTDVSVTLDLMSHDLDLLTMLLGEAPMRILGYPMSVRSETYDACLGMLEFPSGAKVKLHASRAEKSSWRVMDITFPSGTVSIDFNAKTLTHDTSFDLSPDFAQDPLAKDSLGAATNAFVQAVLDGKPIPITAQDGYKALEMALIIDRGTLWEKDG